MLASRTGVNTGEVVASDDPAADQKLATGDAVNVTARLEQAAPANQIYIGEVTYRLVRDAVEAEAVAPLTLKGKSQPVAAYRLLSALGQEGNVRRQDTPVVGRDDELAVLQTAWDTVVAEQRVRLVTVLGDAGIGKSRLVRELMDRLGGTARIVCGRCLAYGDGITFWPLREMVVSTCEIRSDDSPDLAREKLLACTGDADIADRMASATGLSAAPVPVARNLLGLCAASCRGSLRTGPCSHSSMTSTGPSQHFWIFSKTCCKRLATGRCCSNNVAPRPARGASAMGRARALGPAGAAPARGRGCNAGRDQPARCGGAAGNPDAAHRQRS